MGVSQRVGFSGVPGVQLAAHAECLLVGTAPSTSAALAAMLNCEEHLLFFGVALQHYFGAVARV